MERYTLQNLIDEYARKSGTTRKTATSLADTFFDTLQEGLLADGVVKINGLGTFKVVEVADRESVNVNNGERITIAGYRKVTFVPDEATVSVVGNEGLALRDDAEMSLHAKPSTSDENTDFPSVQLNAPDPSDVARPLNEFSGIDTIISTPECVDDLRTQYEAAKQRAAETLQAANEAHAELCRLEKLMEQVTTVGDEPVTQGDSTEQSPDIQPPTPDENNEPAPPAEPPVSAPSPVPSEENEEDIPRPARHRSWLWWLLIPIMLLLLVEVGILIHKYNQPAIPTEQPVIKPRPTKPAKAPAKIDTVAQQAPRDTVAKPDTAPSAAPASQSSAQGRPKTYTLKPGDSLTKIAQQFYGSKDSVRVILRVNKFANPDNVPVGAVINLP
ncbi:MAG: HU family DNA-binding protein [Bacteroidaceae bacterium]|nr:HU family DNA-binding protein [Bacteroidaceae bacterium]